MAACGCVGLVARLASAGVKVLLWISGRRKPTWIKRFTSADTSAFRARQPDHGRDAACTAAAEVVREGHAQIYAQGETQKKIVDTKYAVT